MQFCCCELPLAAERTYIKAGLKDAKAKVGHGWDVLIVLNTVLNRNAAKWYEGLYIMKVNGKG